MNLFFPRITTGVQAYRNRAMLLISHIKGHLEKNLIRMGADTLFALGHHSELWRFFLCIIDFLFQQEDEHFLTAVTDQPRLQRFRGLTFQCTQSEASHLFSALLALNRRWTLKCGTGSGNHKSCFRCLHNSTIKVTIITQNSSLWRFQ